MVVLRYLFLVAAVLSGTVARGFDPSQQDDSLALVRHFMVPERPLEMPDGIGLMGNNDGLTHAGGWVSRDNVTEGLSRP